MTNNPRCPLAANGRPHRKNVLPRRRCNYCGKKHTAPLNLGELLAFKHPAFTPTGTDIKKIYSPMKKTVDTSKPLRSVALK